MALLRAVLLVLLAALASASFAGEGHDHGEAPAASAGPAAPRFVAHSDLFEAVGVLTANELVMLIDRYDSNEPVLQAVVEIESGSFKAQVPFHADHGGYSLPADAFKKPGTYPVTLTITAGDQTDLLAGDLVVPDPEAGHAEQASPWALARNVGLAAALLVLVAIAGLTVRRFRQRPSALARL